MMVDSGPAAEPGTATNVSLKKGCAGNNDYASGGWKREDGSLSCGYASFRGKRASMEDYYDLKSAIIDGQTISFFGIFDGHGGSRASEYLKDHLFDNLTRHPQFSTNTKLAISEAYQKTDSDFLDAESNTSRDDGSTASTAILIGKHLFVANVGDSRAVISKAGKAIPLSDDHKPNRSDERKRIEDAGGVVMWADDRVIKRYSPWNFEALGGWVVYWQCHEHLEIAFLNNLLWQSLRFRNKWSIMSWSF